MIRNLVLKVFVTQQMIHRNSSLQSDLQDVQEGETTSTQKKMSAFFRKYMDSYLKFCFIQCPNTDQLPRPQCVVCTTVLGNKTTKSSRRIRHLKTKHSSLVNKLNEFLCVKNMHLHRTLFPKFQPIKLHF